MFIYTIPGAVGREAVTVEAFTDMWAQISLMSRSGFIDENSTIWFNPNHTQQGMWVLNHRSTHVRVVHTPEAGWAVMDRTRVRLGATKRAALENPRYVYTLSGVPYLGEEKPESTILISHASKDTVSFLAGSQVYPSGTTGTCSYKPFTCVDLPTYTPPENRTPNPIESANAQLNGASLITYGLSPETRDLVYNNIDLFRTEWDEEKVGFVRSAAEALTGMGNVVAGEIYNRVYDSPASKLLSVG